MTNSETPESPKFPARLPAAVCAAVGDVLQMRGTHPSLNALFRRAGAPGDPPDFAHHSKWKEWLLRAGDDPNIDGLSVLGLVLEEFMDIPPTDDSAYEEWEHERTRLISRMEEYGLRYYRAGRVLPIDQPPPPLQVGLGGRIPTPVKPTSVIEVISILVRALPRAMYPLRYRRQNATALSFHSEYDLQDLLHTLLRPWVADIRPEEYTPSYAGSSTRMDLLLFEHSIVIELKFVRDQRHAKKVGHELIVDIEHYVQHPKCETLWCVVYDAQSNIVNPDGFVNDLRGRRTLPSGTVDVRVDVLAGMASTR